MPEQDVLDRITSIVETAGKINNLGSADDFYEAGFSSLNALQLLLDLEDVFGVTIPDDEFVAARTCASLQTLILRLAQKPQ